MSTSLMQRLKGVHEILASGDRLNGAESRECFDAIFDPATYAAEPEGSLSLVGTFILQCDSPFLCQTAVKNLGFWDLLKEVMDDATPQELAIYLNKIVSELLKHPVDHTESLISLCQAVSSDSIILGTLLVNLAAEELSSQTAASILNCISAFFTCHKYLLISSPAEAAHIIPSFISQASSSGLWDALTAMLSNNNGQIEIIEKLLASRRDMLSFLKSTEVNQYETPWKDRLLMAFNSTINLNGDSKVTFKESNGYHSVDTVTLLQAVDITTFLNDKNLTFKKTLTEQLLFGTRPFPLFNACMHVCDTINTMIEKLETKTTDIVNNLTFSLNKDKLLYALMDRLLKSWVESQAETEEDLNSLLILVPIIFERISKSIPESSSLSPHEYLRLALNVIEDINYKLSRQLQLDVLREIGNERWSKQSEYFNDMLTDQVRHYVHHQRLLQLQKGTWAYADNPIDPKIKAPKVYFMVLSPNQAKLLVREYNRICEKIPIIEENNIIIASETDPVDAKSETHVIPISSISTFTSEKISFNDKTPQDSNLVNVIQKNFYTKVELINKSNKPLFHFFFDTKEAIYTWLDGLQLVCSIKHCDGLSTGTTDQIETLIDLRKSVQMINLAEEQIAPGNYDADDDEEFYNIDELKTITSEFYYE